MKKIFLVIIFILACAPGAFAEAPNLFTYQGRLKEGGQAVSGNRLVKILLCDSESGITCHNSGEQSVAVSNGLFRSTYTVPVTVNFGAGNWWLEIWVAGAQLTPRERLASNAYSLFAATAAYAENIAAATGSLGVYISSNLYITGGGKYYGDGSQLTSLPVSGGAVAKAGGIMTGQLTLAGSTLTVAGNAFSVGGSTLVVKDGKVGIGTTAPAVALDVNGAVRMGNYTTAARPLATAANTGALIFDTTVGKLYISNGTVWKPLGTVSYCLAAGDKNTSATVNGNVVYCDNNLRMWTPTAIIGGAATQKTWGPATDEPTDSCVGLGTSYPACNYCDTLTYAGLTGWKLPDKDVLLGFWTIPCGGVLCGSGNAGVSWDTNAQTGVYWSSSEYVPDTTLAWFVPFYGGFMDGYSKASGGYVRCVRGGP